MTDTSKHDIKSLGLEIYDVLVAINIDEDYNFNLPFETTLQSIIFNDAFKHGTTEILKNKLKFSYLMSETPQPELQVMKPKKWHSHLQSGIIEGNASFGLPSIIGPSSYFPYMYTKGFIYDRETPTGFEELERSAFSMVINAQQEQNPQTTNSEIAHTAVVFVLTHGKYECLEYPATSLELYQIPAGKTLTIVSVATPTAVELGNDTYLEKLLITGLHNLISTQNLANEFINPITTADRYFHTILHLKRSYREKIINDRYKNRTDIQNDLPRYMENYTDPRIVYFNEFDNCVEKSFSHKDTNNSAQIRKFNYVGWDTDLMPVGGCFLSTICDFLFHVEGHTNILLFDYSCSVITRRDVNWRSNRIGRQIMQYHLTEDTND